MAGIDFPSNPNVNQQHTAFGNVWFWNGESWRKAGPIQTQGAQGNAGTPGAQGHQGVTGSGAQGATGAQGDNGAQGAIGTQGAQGHQGFQGTIGAQGSQGVVGGGASITSQADPPTGANDGDLWWDSDEGPLLLYYNDGNSSQWVDISTGPMGAQGAQGTQGSRNNLEVSENAPSSPSAGDLWWESDTGILSVYYDDGVGSPSSQWVEIGAGPTGAQGTQGSQGSQGHQGHQGLTGAQGDTGAQGSQGHQGHQGHQGLTGAQGDDGAQGSQGHQGHQGTPGTNAGQGAQGDDGAQGSPGAQGDDGAQGAPGSGNTGAQGSPGAQGADGAQGATGSVNVSNNSNNRVVTATGGTTANAEANLTFDGSQLNLAGDMQFTAANPELEFNNGGPRFRVPAANTLTIHTGGGLGSTNDEILRVHSGGEITKPLQPAFKASRTAGTSDDSGSNATKNFMEYNSTLFNIGNSYSTSTFRFTAPVAGRYYFYASVRRAQSNNGWHQIMKNNSDVESRTEARVENGNIIIFGSALVDMAVNDYVNIRANNTQVLDTCFFGGYLVS